MIAIPLSVEKCVFSRRLGATSLPTDLLQKQNKNELRGLSPRANYIDRATAACRQT
jgi:hypothetical protein